MPTNNVWTALSSRKNIVGMVLAIVAIIVHLVIGLGPLWPVIAVAAWGIGVALTPSSPAPALKSAPSLVDAIATETEKFRALGVSDSSLRQLNQLRWTIGQLEHHMDELSAQPILLQTVNEIAFSHVPTLVTAYEEVPDIARRGAQRELDSSLGLLNQEAGKILSAIVDQKFKGLEDQRALLEQKFSGVSLYLDGPESGH